MIGNILGRDFAVIAEQLSDRADMLGDMRHVAPVLHLHEIHTEQAERFWYEFDWIVVTVPRNIPPLHPK